MFNLWCLYHGAVPVNSHFGQEHFNGIFFSFYPCNAYNDVVFISAVILLFIKRHLLAKSEFAFSPIFDPYFYAAYRLTERSGQRCVLVHVFYFLQNKMFLFVCHKFNLQLQFVTTRVLPSTISLNGTKVTYW